MLTRSATFAPLRMCTPRPLRPGLLILVLTLLTGCDVPGGSATSSAICDELRADLPTWSPKDTAQSLGEGARFVTTFNAVCP